MKTILVPTDYSLSANIALEYAAEMARVLKARIVIYHAYFVSVISSDATIALPGEEELIQENSTKLEAMCQVISNTFQVPATYTTGPMPVVDHLPELMKKWQVDLIVMGMRQLSGFDQRVFGSTTTTVIRQAQFPVLVVPEETTFNGLGQIMFACDYLSLSPDNTLTLLKELAMAFKSHISILHVEAPEDETLTEQSRVRGKKLPNMESVLQGISHDYVFIEEENALKGIEAGIDEFQADLLVMVPQVHGFWDMVMNRSTTRKIVLHTHIPLLTLPNPKPSPYTHR